MKFKIAREALQAGLQDVIHVVGSRATLPILSNVLIVASKGKIRMTSTDLDVGVSGEIDADIEVEGRTTLPVKRLSSIVGVLPASEVEIAVDSKNVATITCGPSFFKIMGLPDSEFPALPTFEDSQEFKIPQQSLKVALKKTSYAISTDETRYVLNGIFMSFHDQKLTLVATDGRRLGLVENDLEYPEAQDGDIIIPTKAVSELQRQLTDSGDVLLQLKDNQVCFKLGNKFIVSKLIDGSYPNYKQVIPGQAQERLEIDRSVLLDTTKRVSLLASDKSNSIKIEFRQGEISLSANTPDVGESSESIPLDYNGKEFAIAFNPDFLMAPLRNIDSPTVNFDFIDEMSPGVIRTGNDFLYVLMPMRVTN